MWHLTWYSITDVNITVKIKVNFNNTYTSISLECVGHFLERDEERKSLPTGAVDESSY